MIAVDTTVLVLSNVYIEKADQLAKALSWYQHGMDFADALHLSLADGAHWLVTFDERFVKSAAPTITRSALKVIPAAAPHIG